MKRPPSRSYKAGKRGRHKHQTSVETQRWEAEHLIPLRPPYMSDDVYHELTRLRSDLERPL